MTLFPETRTSLLAALKSPDDRCAWEEFVVVYRPVFYRMARRREMQDSDAQDLAQQVLLKICGAIEAYEQRPGTQFRHWLRRVANNAIASALSRAPRDVAEGGSEALHKFDVIPESGADISQEFDTEFERELFLVAAARVRSEVNQTTWRAFELTMIEGLTCEQASQTLGKSIGTVYAARSRIVKRLRTQIQRLQRPEE